MPIPSHTEPPTRAPVPIPTLYMPEYMDMATAVPCGAWRIISDWNERLKKLIDSPHSIHCRKALHSVHDAGSSISRQKQSPATAILKKVSTLLL